MVLWFYYFVLFDYYIVGDFVYFNFFWCWVDLVVIWFVCVLVNIGFWGVIDLDFVVWVVDYVCGV